MVSLIDDTIIFIFLFFYYGIVLMNYGIKVIYPFKVYCKIKLFLFNNQFIIIFIF